MKNFLRKKRKKIKVEIYSKADCHLCDEAKEEIEKAGRYFDLDIIEVDITADPSLFEQNKDRIPLIFIEGQLAFKYRVEQKSLLRKLSRV